MDPRIGNGNANAAAADPDVMVYIGPYNSGAAKISMPILNQATADGGPDASKTGLLMISPANTRRGLTKPNPYDPREPGVYRPTGKINYVRVVPTDDLQGPLGGRLGEADGHEADLRARRSRSLRPGARPAVRPALRRHRADVLGYDSIDAHELEFRSLMTRIKALASRFDLFRRHDANQRRASWPKTWWRSAWTRS